MNIQHPLITKNKHWRIDLLITLLGIAGLLFFLAFYESALPDATLDMKYSRDQIAQKATGYLADFGYSPEGYTQAVEFTGGDASVYLQRKLGVAQANQRQASEKWPLYYWQVRWFKPQQAEEFALYLAPDGELVGFSHVVKEDAPGAVIAQQQAQQVAENFLTQYAGWDKTQWERLDAASSAQPGGRTDHFFTWKSTKFSAGDAELHYSVSVQGDQIGSMFYNIKVPESFQRDYASERDQADFINSIALLLVMPGLMFIALVAAFLVTGKPDFRAGLLPAGLVGLVTLANGLNSMSLLDNYYDTTQDYILFWAGQFFYNLLNAVTMTAVILLVWVGAQSLSKLVWPGQDRILARGPQRWLTLSRSAWRGLMFAGLCLGYQTLFYLLTTRYLGWWSPMYAGYDNYFATPLPFVGALESGISAALLEELLARFIGAAFFLWLFRKRLAWLAVLIPGMLWAFAHTSYATFPIYVRGVELTVVAMLWGYVFFKFDLFTTLMAHFTFNAMLGAMPLLRADVPYYRFSGLVVLLVLALPLMPGLVWNLRRRLGKLRLPANISIALAGEADGAALAVMPARADWPALLADSARVTLCLRADDELIGFATGRVGELGNGLVDGVYVDRRWRRQYWGSALLETLQAQLASRGATGMRVVLLSGERQPAAFLSNLFWRSSAQVLAPAGAITIGGVLGGLKAAWKHWRQSGAEEGMDIPRQVL